MCCPFNYGASPFKWGKKGRLLRMRDISVVLDSQKMRGFLAKREAFTEDREV